MQQSAIQVLVVEDHHLILMGAVAALKEAGFAAIGARSAEEAIQILETNSDVRVVFTDVDMAEGMDGIKLAYYIRRRWPPVKLIVTSGSMILDERHLPEGTSFFRKPYDDTLIAKTINDMFLS